jgi:hypothetical protein
MNDSKYPYFSNEGEGKNATVQPNSVNETHDEKDDTDGYPCELSKSAQTL